MAAVRGCQNAQRHGDSESCRGAWILDASRVEGWLIEETPLQQVPVVRTYV